MKNNQHTCGKWTIDQHLHASNGAIWGPDGMTVCNVTDRGGETRGNASLISAAPEMLAALEMVRDADNDCHRDGLETIPRPARQKIDAAIAKARGT